MRTAFRRRLRPPAALLIMLPLSIREVTLVTTAPSRDRSLADGIVLSIVLAAAAAVGTAAYRFARRVPLPAAHTHADAPGPEDFPMDEIRPYLLSWDPVDLNRLYTAWEYATHGRGSAWIERHLRLPAEVARPLVEAARRHSGKSPRL